MPRSARIVVPHVPHHVIQRGNRRDKIFLSDQGRRLYLSYLTAACAQHGVKCLAWCLMSNHVHLILVPPTADALRATMASTHTRYAQWFNRSQQATGHLFEGRFHSYAMDDAHLVVAARYVENNPVKAGLARHAWEWPWSSARCHVEGLDDGLTDRAALSRHLPNWRAYLELGAEASEQDAGIEAALVSGRPQGNRPEFAGLIAPPKRRGRPWPARPT